MGAISRDPTPALEQPHPAQGLQVMQRQAAGGRDFVTLHPDSLLLQNQGAPSSQSTHLPSAGGTEQDRRAAPTSHPQRDLQRSGNVKQTKSPERRSCMKKRAADLGAQGNLCEFQADRNVLAAGNPTGVTWHRHGSAGAFASLLRRAPCPGRGSMCDSLFTHSPCPEATPKHISCHVVLQRDVPGPGFVPCFALLSSFRMHA